MTTEMVIAMEMMMRTNRKISLWRVVKLGAPVDDKRAIRPKTVESPA
jgi:hypothetical protein